MLFFGHLGIGRTLVHPLSRGLPVPWIFLGTLLPDLLDKALYYTLSWSTGRHGVELGLISGTRTFGHTAFLMFVLLGVARLRSSRALFAVSIGVLSHLMIDSLSEWIEFGNNREILKAILWPLLGWNFPVLPFRGINAHLFGVLRPWILWTEGIGLLLLWGTVSGRIRSKLTST